MCIDVIFDIGWLCDELSDLYAYSGIYITFHWLTVALYPHFKCGGQAKQLKAAII